MLCYNEVTLQAAKRETTSMVPPPPPTPVELTGYKTNTTGKKWPLVKQWKTIMSVTICVLTGTETCFPKRELETGAVSLVKVHGLGVHRI